MGFLKWLFGIQKKDSDKDLQHDSNVEKVKKIYLHRDAHEFLGGVCSEGQARQENLIVNNRNLLKGVVYTSVLDNACCPKCWPLDGIVFDIDIEKRPPVPRHENCRCLYTPKTKTFRDFGIDIDELPPVGRPWVLADYQYTYKRNPEKKLKKPRRIIRKHGIFKGNAEEWIRTLPAHEQRPFFPSDVSYALWKSGKIKGIDMLNPETWELRSDEELIRLFSR